MEPEEKPAKLPELLTETEVADWLGVTGQTLRNWRSEQSGPSYVKIEGSIRYTREQILIYLDNCTVEVTSD